MHGYKLKAENDIRKGISGTRVQVIIDDQHQHIHDHDHDHGNLHHHHHNSFSEIRQMILASSLNDDVKDLSIAIFEKVADAEAKIHNTPVDDVHFHEVGAIDSIVDIVGAAICMDNLAPDEFNVPPLNSEADGSLCPRNLSCPCTCYCRDSEKYACP